MLGGLISIILRLGWFWIRGSGPFVVITKTSCSLVRKPARLEAYFSAPPINQGSNKGEIIQIFMMFHLSSNIEKLGNYIIVIDCLHSEFIKKG